MRANVHIIGSACICFSILFLILIHTHCEVEIWHLLFYLNPGNMSHNQGIYLLRLLNLYCECLNKVNDCCKYN